MALTTAQLDTLIESARVALQSALDNPKPNYGIGARTVSFADYINTLQENLTKLVELQSSSPSEIVRDFDSEITAVGTDNTEYEGDSNI